MPVESPCNSKCKLHNEVCVGCGRTRAEIRAWRKMTDKEKQSVIDRLKNENKKQED